MTITNYFFDTILAEFLNEPPSRMDPRDRMYFPSPLSHERLFFASLHDADGDDLGAPRPRIKFNLVAGRAYSSAASFRAQPYPFHISHVVLWDSKVGGNALFHVPFAEPIPADQPFTLAEGMLTLTID